MKIAAGPQGQAVAGNQNVGTLQPQLSVVPKAVLHHRNEGHHWDNRRFNGHADRTIAGAGHGQFPGDRSARRQAHLTLGEPCEGPARVACRVGISQANLRAALRATGSFQRHRRGEQRRNADKRPHGA